MKKFKVVEQGCYFIPGIRQKKCFGEIFEVSEKVYDIVLKCRVVEEVKKDGCNRKQ